MNWFAFIMSSALVLGLYDFNKKHALSNNRVMPVLFISSLVGLVVLTVVQFATGHLAEFFLCSWKSWGLIFLKSFIVAFSWTAGFYALHDLPISLVAPVLGTSPLGAAIGGAIFFGEYPNWIQILGMLIVFFGLWRFTGISQSEGFSWKGRSMLLLFTATLLAATSGIYDRYLLKVLELDVNLVQFQFYVNLCVILMFFWLAQPHVALLREQNPFRWKWSILAIGICLLFTDWLYYCAVADPAAQLGVLSVLRRTSVIFSFLCGAFYFHEKDIRSKALALFIVLAGVFLLGIS